MTEKDNKPKVDISKGENTTPSPKPGNLINKSQDPDWSKKGNLSEGYKPFVDTTNPNPPTETGTGGSKESDKK